MFHVASRATSEDNTHHLDTAEGLYDCNSTIFVFKLANYSAIVPSPNAAGSFLLSKIHTSVHISGPKLFLGTNHAPFVDEAVYFFYRRILSEGLFKESFILKLYQNVEMLGSGLSARRSEELP